MKGVFGHDHQSLAETLQPALSFPFELKWVQEEDVLLLPLYPEGQTEANIESGLRSAKFVVQGLADVRAREVLGCHSAEGAITWVEAKIDTSLKAASAWAKPRSVAPAHQRLSESAGASTQSRWTTLGAARGTGGVSSSSSNTSTRSTTPNLSAFSGPIAESWDTEP